MSAAVAERIDWDALSPEAKATIRVLGSQLSEGFSRTELLELVRQTTPCDGEREDAPTA